MSKREGDVGEELACNYLLSKGFKILHKKYRSRFGEIDIIAAKGDLVVFVEVKYRSSSAFGKGFESVSKNKIDKIIKTSQYFIASHSDKYNYRYDVISIDDGKITHIENAFQYE